ncbi:NAD(+)/NADH kinase [Methanosalsum natronophilum]|uniref:NAD(+)/NADH kinase n=1 Tax=Methanosalsum natronophilum TaxID=768733 RepID=UPI002169C82E|nr:NAD(+)/NADH kinase [Methanosalsum natronophilum]MCS3924482.1 NAD+ kinase [Methanosalsum natronophilum]
MAIIKKIAIVAKSDSQAAIGIAQNILEKFSDVVEIILSPSTARSLSLSSLRVPIVPIKSMRYEGAELLICIGGDGTVLRSISKMEDPLPILGINVGTLGFLVDVSPHEALNTIERILSGFTYNERLRLDVKFNGEKLPSATNEAVLITGRPAKILTFKIQVDQCEMEELRADGVVFATPTGSTAYAMSAGGPIVDPRVDAAVIVPLAPFKLSARPWVVPADSILKIRVTIPEKKAAIVIDGQYTYHVSEKDEVFLTEAKNPARFVDSSLISFYEKVQNKLM